MISASAHWSEHSCTDLCCRTGDNAANWQALYDSIAAIINPSFWGINMVGPDICGFVDIAEKGRSVERLPDAEYEELCNR